MANEKKGFLTEFKEFITRGNVLDMAVGIIIGGAFTAIVNALTNQILMPVINWFLFLITGGKGLENIYTYLHKVEVDGAIDLVNSIYIDWGAFITAVINFILIALVLFLIVRTINRIRARADELKAKKEAEAAAAAQEAEPAPEPAEPAAPPAPTSEELLTEIRDLLKSQKE